VITASQPDLGHAPPFLRWPNVQTRVPWANAQDTRFILL
jgi:hypothetical protein